jgi:hypothetical protein
MMVTRLPSWGCVPWQRYALAARAAGRCTPLDG